MIQRRRQGAAVAELALTLPFLVVFVLGSIETCSMVFLRQAIVTTAYESARISIRDDASTADALARAQEVITGRGIDVANTTVVFNPADIEGLARGTPISVTVTVPADEFSIVPILNIANITLTASINMVKE